MSKEQKEKELEALRQKLEGGSPNDGLAVIEAAMLIPPILNLRILGKQSRGCPPVMR